ncbi:MAG TPA: orotidine-5'-phosphate decarboxylase [Polyangiaceae bacterium]
MSSAAPAETPSGRARLVFPLDYASLSEARAGAERVCAGVGVLKVGLELFVREGPPAAKFAAELGCRVFLDLKLHDIPETVSRAVASACQLGVDYLTVHASGGPGMLEAAVRSAARENTGLKLLAVTVLTSSDQGDLLATGVADAPAAQVLRLAHLAHRAGVPGLVCSALELSVLRAQFGRDLVLVTPGIRPAGADAGDQKRVATPADAVRAGADLLVIGRPIRDSPDPLAAALAIVRAIESVP